MRFTKLTVGVITLGIVLLMNLLFSYSSSIYESFYLNGLFQLFRCVHDYTLGLLPIPSIYLIVPAFFYYFLRGNMGSMKSFLYGLTCSLIWIINLFYILWGFNYQQPSIYDSMGLTKAKIDSAYITSAYLEQTEVVNALSSTATDTMDYKQLEASLRTIQERLLSEWGVPTVGKVRIRKVPSGILLRIRTSGVYIPHALEGHLDGGLYHKQHPFTLAHEMAHGYGYTDESVCNFIAYITCLSSEDDHIRYSAELAYWRYLARYYAYYHPDEWSRDYEYLAPGLRGDLEEIRKHIRKYKDFMPVMRDKIYDNYLKTHGVKAGIKSYDQIIHLVAAYKAKFPLAFD